jgi:hypothetical protein
METILLSGPKKDMNSIGKLLNLNPQILISISIMSFFIWIASVRLTSFEVDDLGIIATLHPGYYLSIIMLQFSFFMKLVGNNKSKVLLWMDTIFCLCYLFLTPALLEGIARVPNSWDKFGYTDYIIRNNTLNPAQLWYHNWPVFHIFSANFVNITGVPYKTFLLYFPFLLHLLFLPVIILLFSKIFQNDRLIWFGVWIFLFFNWVNQDHFTSQYLGLFFYILILALIIKIYRQNNLMGQKKIISIGFLLFFTLILTHLLTTLLLCLNMFVLIIFLQKQARISKKLLIYGSIVILLSIIIWFLFAQKWILPLLGSTPLGRINLDRIYDLYISKIFEGNEGHKTVVLFRIIFTGVIFLVALFGTYLIPKENRLLKRSMWLLIICAALPIPFITYSGEIIQRFFLFSIIPATILIAKGTDNRRFLTFVIALLFISTPIHILTHYGNEKIDYLPATQLTGVDYFYSLEAADGAIISTNSAQGYIFRENYPIYPLNIDSLKENTTQYVWITSSWKNHQSFYYDDPGNINEIENILVTNTSYFKIYSNPYFDLFKNNIH